MGTEGNVPARESRVQRQPDNTTTSAEAVPEWYRLGTQRAQAVLRIQHGVLRHLRDVLDEAGCLESLAPIIGEVTDPGTRGGKQATIRQAGRRWKVMSSAILYKQLMLHATKRVYMMAPCIRFEPEDTATTGRHLTEFYQCDVELRDAKLGDATGLAEHLIREVVHRVQQSHAEDLASIDAPSRDLSAPFKHLTHAEAITTLRGLGFDADERTEIPWDQERALSLHFDVPIVLTHYPRGARGFYDKLDPDTGLLLDFDVLYPDGYGEAVSGAERQHDLRTVVERMREAGEDPKKYGWYIDMLRDGCPPSAGFGIGVERLTRFICGLDSVTEARPFPKTAGRHAP